MTEKPVYKFRMEDFIPINGIKKYVERTRPYPISPFVNRDREVQRISNNVVLRNVVLTMYNGTVFSPIAYLAIVGLERLAQ